MFVTKNAKWAKYRDEVYRKYHPVIIPVPLKTASQYKIKIVCPQCHMEQVILKSSFNRKACDAWKKNAEYIYRCYSCMARGTRNNNWKGGRQIDKRNGYVMLSPNLFPDIRKFFPDDNHKRYGVLEHRYVMAKHLNRSLLSSECIHHINGVRGDNRLENLEVVSPLQHRAITIMETEWNRKITDLEEENAKLREQLSELVSD